jgi:hypothetical protein
MHFLTPIKPISCRYPWKPQLFLLTAEMMFSDRYFFFQSLTAGVFDRAEVNIWSLMQFNMWPRFATSPFIKLIGSNSSTSFGTNSYHEDI